MSTSTSLKRKREGGGPEGREDLAQEGMQLTSSLLADDKPYEQPIQPMLPTQPAQPMQPTHPEQAPPPSPGAQSAQAAAQAGQAAQPTLTTTVYNSKSLRPCFCFC